MYNLYYTVHCHKMRKYDELYVQYNIAIVQQRKILYYAVLLELLISNQDSFFSKNHYKKMSKWILAYRSAVR